MMSAARANHLALLFEIWQRRQTLPSVIEASASSEDGALPSWCQSYFVAASQRIHARLWPLIDFENGRAPAAKQIREIVLEELGLGEAQGKRNAFGEYAKDAMAQSAAVRTLMSGDDQHQLAAMSKTRSPRSAKTILQQGLAIVPKAITSLGRFSHK